MSWKERMLELMKADGITSTACFQEEIKAWYQRCGVWAYPTSFDEINCLSAIKAQCWGAIPVVINRAALQTTVKYGSRSTATFMTKKPENSTRWP